MIVRFVGLFPAVRNLVAFSVSKDLFVQLNHLVHGVLSGRRRAATSVAVALGRVDVTFLTNATDLVTLQTTDVVD